SAAARPSAPLSARALPAGDLGGERVEPRAPEAAEAVEPGVDLGQGARVDGVDEARSLGAHGREAVLAQDLELLRDGRLGDAELAGDDLDDLARGVLTFRQKLEDSPPNGIAEDVEGVHQVPV